MKVSPLFSVFSRRFPWFWGLLLGFCLTLGWSAVSPLQAQPPLSQAQTLYQAGDFQGALPLWRRLAETFKEEKNFLNQGMALSNLALTYQQLGDWQAATQAIEESRQVLAPQTPSPEQERLLRQALIIQGQLRLQQGAPQAALTTWQSAEAIGKPDLETRFDLQRQQAEAYQALGMYPRACNALLTALGLPPKDCQISAAQLESLKEPEQAPILLALGATQRQMGRLESAWEILLTADRLTDNSALKAEIRLNQGNILKAMANRQLTPAERQNPRLPAADRACQAPLSSGLGTFSLYRQALTCYQDAEALAPGRLGQHQARFNRGQLLAQLRQWPSLPPLLTALAEDVDKLPPGRSGTTSRFKLAQTLMCLKQGFNPQPLLSQSPLLQSCPLPNAEERRQYREAFSPFLTPERSRRLLDQARQEAEALGDPALLANFWGYEGAWLAQQGQGEAALAATERAVEPITAYQNPELSYLWQWQLGRFAQVQGQTDRALAAYNAAYASLESLRQELAATPPDLQFGFRERVEPVYRELVALLLLEANPSQENLRRSRDILESLQLAELNNFFQEACLEANPQSIETIDPKAAVIYATTLPDRLAVILSLPDQPLAYHSVPLGDPRQGQSAQQALQTVVDEMLINIFDPAYRQSLDLRYSQQLYKWLIAPLAPALQRRQIQTLVFVMDGSLRGVPLAALHDGRRFLVEKYAIAFTPGLQLLSPRALSAESLSILIGGLANTQNHPDFDPIPEVKTEVAEISESSATQVLFDEDFTAAGLQAELRKTPFPVVHLATHGLFSSKSEDTFLLAWDKKINVKELDQLLRERGDLTQAPLELLTLSACQTATGDDQAPLGLAGVALRSGARSTVATLWRVFDESTAHLMTDFYRSLRQSQVSKAEALRQSQAALLKSERFNHPYYWAPFVLVGNWL